jgi:hypothetical protein
MRIVVAVVLLLASACRRDPPPPPPPIQAPPPVAAVAPRLTVGLPGARLVCELPVHGQLISQSKVEITAEVRGEHRRFRAERVEPTDPWTLAPWPDQPAGAAKLEPGTGEGPIELSFAGLAFAWPMEFAVDAFGGDVPRAELRRDGGLRDVMVVIRGPVSALDVPPVAELVGPGQTRIGGEDDAEPPWIDVGYAHDDEEWIQRHYRIEHDGQVVLVTAQAPTYSAMPYLELAHAIAERG